MKDNGDVLHIRDSPRTASYSPPELLARGRFGRDDVDATKVDAWAAGVLAYFVFTGCHPFDDGAAVTRDADVERRILSGAAAAGAFDAGGPWDRVPEAMRPLVARCLSADPGARPTLRDLADAPWVWDDDDDDLGLPQLE